MAGKKRSAAAVYAEDDIDEEYEHIDDWLKGITKKWNSVRSCVKSIRNVQVQELKYGIRQLTKPQED